MSVDNTEAAGKVLLGRTTSNELFICLNPSGTVTGTPTTLSTAGIRLWHIGWWEGHSRSLSGWKQLLMEQSQPARAGPITPTPAAALTAFQQGMCMVPLSSVIGAIVQKHCSIRI